MGQFDGGQEAGRRGEPRGNSSVSLPDRIPLRALDQEWNLELRPTDARCVTEAERPGHRLLVFGAVEKTEAVRELLRRWLLGRAQAELEPRLRELAREKGIPQPPKVVSRLQRSRWGSRSSRGTISLNGTLLFLPHPLVRYVLLHELAHVVEMNHSPRFWVLLRGWEPRCEVLRAELCRDWSLYIPFWCLR
jgi:predicted metal-dependent hydrolase